MFRAISRSFTRRLSVVRPETEATLPRRTHIMEAEVPNIAAEGTILFEKEIFRKSRDFNLNLLPPDLL